jgi:hypothetical protein
MRPRILIGLLCSLERHGWINPDLTMTLVKMGRDQRYDCDFAMIMDYRPHEFARNTALATARYGKYDWCIQFDNDNNPSVSPLDVIASAPDDADILGMRYGTTNGRSGAKFFPTKAPSSTYEEVPEVAGGVLMIRNSVWAKIPRGPWFSWMFKQGSEVLESAMGEDTWFCAFARSRGLKIYLHEAPASHLHTQDISALAQSQSVAKAAAR